MAAQKNTFVFFPQKIAPQKQYCGIIQKQLISHLCQTTVSLKFVLLISDTMIFPLPSLGAVPSELAWEDQRCGDQQDQHGTAGPLW